MVDTASVEDEQVYRCMVVDSGPIIKLTGVSSLWKKANAFYTVPEVLQEIKDEKARDHLQNLPFELVPKEPSARAVKAIIDFARQTGDYQSLSSVDIQVLALLYDLEREGCCGDMSHVRTVPKRTLGVGKFEMLAGETKTEDVVDGDNNNSNGEKSNPELVESASKQDSVNTPELKQTTEPKPQQAAKATGPPKSWASLLGGSSVQIFEQTNNVAETNAHVPFGKMNISAPPTEAEQFDDADEDEDEVMENTTAVNPSIHSTATKTAQEELALAFPSLAAAATVPYDGSDEETEVVDEEERKRLSLQPISKSGKLYPTDSVVKKLSKPSKKGKKSTTSVSTEPLQPAVNEAEPEPTETGNQSRIIGGITLAGQEADVEDDGEGWITTTQEIQTMKANGSLDPLRKGGGVQSKPQNNGKGPPLSQRAACTTTDFAMQNVILQMNLELLSVDGMKIRKLKSWVRRCGACFKVYTDDDNTGPIKGKRLFCERCGSDMIQRIACSVDGKTGRLRLHLSKNYKHNLRGTKFSLPKPNSGDRFQGDLLLREDQLMMRGTWNQKAKMHGGGKAKAASESIFGRDIAKNVGCHVNNLSTDDIQVGFGRRNPNAAKGRERRGKKKKASNKACGLRRY